MSCRATRRCCRRRCGRSPVRRGQRPHQALVSPVSVPSRSGTNAQAYRTRRSPDLRRGGGVRSAATGQRVRPPPRRSNSKMAPSATADTRKLIGRNIKNADGETVGEISRSTSTRTARSTASWLASAASRRRRPRGPHRLVGSQDHRQRREGHGQHDQGRAQGQARVQVQERSDDRQVFTDTGPWAARPSDAARAADAPRPERPACPDDQAAGRPRDRWPPTDRPPTDRPPTTGRPPTGRTSPAHHLDWRFQRCGRDVGQRPDGRHGAQRQAPEAVGKIEEVYVDDSGAINTVVVAVGGFLGVGAKDVAVKWSDLKFSREDKSIVIVDFDQEVAEGHAGLQVRTAPARQQVGRQIDGRQTKGAPIGCPFFCPFLADQPTMNGFACAS